MWITKIRLILDVVLDDLWIFLVVFGMISTCGQDGSGGWVLVMMVVRLLFFGLVDFRLEIAVVASGRDSICGGG